jgi:putative phosphonate metabolism protein
LSARYAIYYAPAQGSLLWQAGCQWLGRDPATGALLDQPQVPGCAPEQVHRLTAAARVYGLHATLKPPFFLADGRSVGALQRDMDAFSQVQPAVPDVALQVAPLAGFLALQPVAASAELMALAAQCVARFDDFRRPADAQELARRRAAGLSPRQDALLQQFGYPYVLDQFRFHITLTDRLATDQMQPLQAWLAGYFSAALRERLTLSDICLFVQDAPGVAFRLVRRCPLQGR